MTMQNRSLVPFVLAALVAVPAAAQVNVTVNGSLGDLDGNGDGGAGEAAVLGTAVQCWANRVGTVRNFTLTVAGGPLTGGTIGQGAVSAVDGAGVPTAGGLTMDNDGSTVYFVDPTPLDNSEFTPDANSHWRFTGGPNTDLFAVVTHEIGHAMAWLCGVSCGFTNPNYDALMNPPNGSFVSNPACAAPFPLATQPALPGCVHLQAGGAHPYDVALRGDGLGGSGSSVVNELSHPGITGELMIGFYSNNAREIPSPNSVDVFAHAYGDAVNLPLTANAGADVVSECNGTGGSNVSLNGNGSTDPEGDALTFQWSCPGVMLSGANTATPSGFFVLDQTVTCRLDATDLAACPGDADRVDVSVEDTTPPMTTCPAPASVECTAAGGTPATDAGIQAFLGAATAADVCDGAPVISNDAPSFFPLGPTVVTFSGEDGSGNADTCGSTLTVVDTTPPVIDTLTVTPSLLWPPNHKMVAVTVAVSVTDICDPSASCQISAITSDEPVNGGGDGNTSPDWVITGPLTAHLRAERSGQGDGRVYTLTVACEDGSGNESTGQVGVLVPHDRR